MAMQRKRLPYEILLRFNYGHVPGNLGDFAGAHFIEADIVLDDDGNVVGVSPGQAQPLPREKVQEYLGAQFTDFERQHREQTEKIRVLQGEASARAEKIAALEATLSVEREKSRATAAKGVVDK